MATTAGLLALLAGASNLIGAGVLLNAFRGNSAQYDRSLTIFATLGALVLAFALIYGAIQLFRRDETGRYTVIVAAGSMVVLGLVALVCALTGYESSYGIRWFTEGARTADATKSIFGLVGTLTALVHQDWIDSLIATVLPLATFASAASRHAARWVTTSPRRRTIPLDAPTH
jgi:hypothetical protein